MCLAVQDENDRPDEALTKTNRISFGRVKTRVTIITGLELNRASNDFVRREYISSWVTFSGSWNPTTPPTCHWPLDR